MKNHLCLNCAEMTARNFCSNCGQKTDTHRITLKHFLLHDLLHGVWHFEKGMLFTVREIIVRPGKASLDYIKGKRIGYYNIFYLSLLVIALDVLLIHFAKGFSVTHNTIQTASSGEAFMDRYGKMFLFCTVPVLSVNARMIFRRLQLNLAEHLIIGGAGLLGMLLMSVLFFCMNVVVMLNWVPDFFGFFQALFILLIPFVPFWVYYDATRGYYKFSAYLWRMILFYILMFIEMIVLFCLLYYILTGGNKNIEFN
jgi:hypothetical protein